MRNNGPYLKEGKYKNKQENYLIVQPKWYMLSVSLSVYFLSDKLAKHT